MTARRRAVLAPLAAGALLAGVLCGLAGAGAAVAADDPPPIDSNMIVTVAPAATSAPASSGSGSTGTRVTTTTTVDASTVTTGGANPPVPASDEFSLGGILYVSGLSSSYAPSLNPLDGSLHTQFTVLNVSTATIDSSARFWITNPFGAEISGVGPIDVTGLKPQESRVIDATLSGVGQWTFATAHFTLTPPETVDGVPLEPLTRDAFVFLPPWFLLALGALAGAVYVVVRIVRYGNETVIDGSLAGSTA